MDAQRNRYARTHQLGNVGTTLSKVSLYPYRLLLQMYRQVLVQARVLST